MSEKTDGTSGIPEHGSSNAPAGSGGAAQNLGGMPRSFADLDKIDGAPAGGGNPPGGKTVEPARPLSDLSKRVMERFGATPFKIVAALCGYSAAVGKEDSALLGECHLDVVRNSAVTVPPDVEARWRLAAVYGGIVGEGFLEILERGVAKAREAAKANGS